MTGKGPAKRRISEGMIAGKKKPSRPCLRTLLGEKTIGLRQSFRKGLGGKARSAAHRQVPILRVGENPSGAIIDGSWGVVVNRIVSSCLRSDLKFCPSRVEGAYFLGSIQFPCLAEKKDAASHHCPKDLGEDHPVSKLARESMQRGGIPENRLQLQCEKKIAPGQGFEKGGESKERGCCRLEMEGERHGAWRKEAPRFRPLQRGRSRVEPSPAGEWGDKFRWASVKKAEAREVGAQIPNARVALTAESAREQRRKPDHRDAWTA